MRHFADAEILRLAIPGIVTNITVPLLGWVDLMLAGRAIATTDDRSAAQFVGAVALGTMAFNVMYWLLGFLRMSTSGLTAQAYGACDGLRCRRLFAQAMSLAAAIGLLLLLLQRPLCGLMHLVMGASGEVWPMVKTYFGICIWGAPAVLGGYALTGWFIGMQDTRTPMLVSISQNVVNIVCSLLFVVGLHMKIEGVALGTLIAQWVGLAMGLYFFREKLTRHTLLQTAAPTFDFRGGLSFLSVSRDIFLRTLCLVAVNLWFVSAGARQGDVVLAANALLMTFFTLFSYVLDGFANAGEALTGRYYGKRQAIAGEDGADSLRRVVVRLYQWGGGMAVLFTLAYAFAGTAILRLFTDSGDVLLAANPYQPWATLVPLAGFAAFVADGVCIGLTRTRLMLLGSALATAVFFAVSMGLPLVVGACSGWNVNHALWLALILYLLIRGIVQTTGLFTKFFNTLTVNA